MTQKIFLGGVLSGIEKEKSMAKQVNAAEIDSKKKYALKMEKYEIWIVYKERSGTENKKILDSVVVTVIWYNEPPPPPPAAYR